MGYDTYQLLVRSLPLDRLFERKARHALRHVGQPSDPLPQVSCSASARLNWSLARCESLQGAGASWLFPWTYGQINGQRRRKVSSVSSGKPIVPPRAVRSVVVPGRTQVSGNVLEIESAELSSLASGWLVAQKDVLW